MKVREFVDIHNPYLQGDFAPVGEGLINAEPVARVLPPQRVPYGFHGIWIPADEMISSGAL